MTEIVSLYSMIFEDKLGKQAIQSILSEFSCPLDKDIENFVRNKAYDFERVGMARSYLVYSASGVFCAFFSLSTLDLKIDKNLSRQEKKLFFGTTYPLGQTIKTYLIGQLSKNYTNHSNQLIDGNHLIGIVLQTIVSTDPYVPSTAIHIDCKDNEELKSFYEKSGFYLMPQNDSELLVYLMPTQKLLHIQQN